MAALTDHGEAAGAVPQSRMWFGKARLGVNVWEAALDRMREVYQQFDHVVVSFSGGKDSTATLHVALEVAHEDPARLPLRVVFFDEECISYQTEDYVRRVARRPDVDLEWYCLPVQHRNACSPEQPYWWPWAPEDVDLWVRPLPPEALTRLEGFPLEPPAARMSIPKAGPTLLHPFERYGHTAQLLGFRSAESLMRARALAWPRERSHVVPTDAPHVANVYPVFDWSKEDVWTAPATFGWDTNATYSVMEMAGIPHHSQRCAPPFGEEPIRDLWMWAECFPELWERMCERVPGASAAARYSRTELYGFGAGATQLEKPAGQTWQEYVRQCCAGHDDPAVARWAARRIQEMIRMHFRHTTDPLMPNAKHPLSGMSWSILAAVAQRGDTKNRRLVMTPRPRSQWEALRKAYDRERARVDAGELEG